MSLAPWAAPLAESVCAAYARLGSVAWIHGQGSVFAGFTDDSDLDFIMVWNGALPAPGHGALGDLVDGAAPLRRTEQPESISEHCLITGHEIDIMHITYDTFTRWCDEVRAGRGWQQEAWPLPLHAVSGFVYGELLTDPSRQGEQLRSAMARPSSHLVQALRDALTDQLPGYVAQLELCESRGDHWLHQLLATQLIRLTYLTWFACEGYFCPFPKRLGQWFERFGFNPDAVELEHQIWTAHGMTAKTDRIKALGGYVLNHIGRQATSRAT